MKLYRDLEHENQVIQAENAQLKWLLAQIMTKTGKRIMSFNKRRALRYGIMIIENEQSVEVRCKPVSIPKNDIPNPGGDVGFN